MAGVELGTLWSAAGVIAGFQVAAFTWRITHELYMSDKGEPCGCLWRVGTLIRSENTGASHKCRIGRAGSPYSVTHGCCGGGPPRNPATTTWSRHTVTSYRLAAA